jgi:hypothetical protein
MSMEAIEPSASSSANEWMESNRRPASRELRTDGSVGELEFGPGTKVARATRFEEFAIASSGSVLVVHSRTMIDPGIVWPTRAVCGGWTTMSMAY